jgi:IclR family acetate operon transcriptional repressor
LAAFQPELLEAALVLGLPMFTPNTRITAAALETELADVRRRGFAVDDEEMYAGTRCIAAPVRNGLGQAVAAIGISGPTVRITAERVPEYARVVVEAAVELSSALGYLADGSGGRYGRDRDGATDAAPTAGSLRRSRR